MIDDDLILVPYKLYMYVSLSDITPQMLPQRPTEERIIKDIFAEYDIDSRGNRRAESGIVVIVDLHLLALQGLVSKCHMVLLDLQKK